MRQVVMVLATAGMLLADFRYEQTTRVTKGAVTKFKKPEPVVSTTYMKGGRMATVTKDSRSVIDFDKQIMLHVDLAKKQYWQLTFAEMRQMMADVQQELNQKNAKMDMKFDVKATGQRKEVNGFDSREVIFTIETGTGDGKNSSPTMKMVADSWHSEAVPGYGEYKAFYERLKDKASWLSMGNPMAQMSGQPGMAEGMRRMAEEVQKTPGLPVLQISRMTMPGMNFSGGSGGTSGGQQAEAPSVGSVLGGALGGRFGGLGRRKKEEPAPAPKAPVETPQPAGEGMLMMESFTESSGFSTEAISEEVFVIPAGFTQIEPEMMKRRKR